jgi:hypothetical protein
MYRFAGAIVAAGSSRYGIMKKRKLSQLITENYKSHRDFILVVYLCFIYCPVRAIVTKKSRRGLIFVAVISHFHINSVGV